ncbi:hypothetical protein PMAYCL1PPCAC_05351, partial [Pristionchus mayeri]
SRMIVLAKRFNVPAVIDDIRLYLNSKHCYEGLKIILFFGHDRPTMFCCNYEGKEHLDWKSIYKQIQRNPAYKAMDADETRDMFEWMMNITSKMNASH